LGAARVERVRVRRIMRCFIVEFSIFKVQASMAPLEN
jgi:hypothetical protein